MLKFIWDDIPEKYDDKALINSILFEPETPEYPLKNNYFIQADNYPALQKLAENFSSKINLIYIDPPYNTGNSFAYNDKFYTGNKYIPSAEPADYHSTWLSFMNRRLKCAKELLSQNGVIFIAIDQSELYNLKILCDQIFGEENFVNDFMWLHGKGKKDTWSRTLQQHTLCYAKNKKELKPFEETEYSSWATKNVDNDPRGNWFSGSISFTENRSNPKHKNYFTIKSPSGIEWTRQWMVSKQQMEELLQQNKIYFGPAPEYAGVPRQKIFNDEESKIIPKNIIDCVESTRHAQEHLDSLLGYKGLFENPKPVDLISHLIEITQLPEDSIIMDFFAGSGTTFESVCALNKKDGGKRKCILIQKPEPLQNTKKLAAQNNIPFKTIADLCWKRIQVNAQEYSEICKKIVLNEKE